MKGSVESAIRVRCIHHHQLTQHQLQHACTHTRVRTILAACRVEELLLVRVLRDEAVHGHLLLLSDAVAARHGLQVVLWVPVRVVDDARVGDGQRDALAARACGQQEHKAAERWEGSARPA